jgi:benzylsuccinate CoA-transferase BbsE subunit
MAEASSTGALAGIRVLDLTTEMGQYAGKLLADLGADVIKVEPPGGDAARGVGPFAHDKISRESSLSWWYFNTNKRSVTCNLDEHDGQHVFRQLARGADLILESHDTGYMDARGVGFDALRAESPQLIYVSITGFGLEGPHAGWKATDIVGLASSGVLTMSGDGEDPPQTLGGNQGYITASLAAAQGATLALFHKERTGEGQLVEVSMQEALSIAQETAIQQWDFQKTSRERQGEVVRVPGIGTYKTQDGYVYSMVGAPAGASLSVMIDWLQEHDAAGDLAGEHEEEYRALNWATLGAALADPAKMEELLKLFPAAQAALAAFFASRTSLEIYEEGQSRRLLIGMVSTPQDLVESKQLKAREWMVSVEQSGETIALPGPPYRLSATPVQYRRPAPSIGEHNVEVWVGEVGIPDEDLTVYVGEGAI